MSSVPVRARLAIIFAVVIALVAAGCGVPRDDAPQVIASDQLPIELVEGQQATSSTPLSPDATDFQIWMVGGDNKLATVAREIPRTPEAVLTALLNGTFPEERALDITSAITRSTGATVVGVQEEDRIAFVDLTEGSLEGIAASEQELAFAQIVYSLTGLVEIDSVVFTIDGEAISFRIDGGATNPGQAVSRTDFESLIRTRPNFGADEDNGDDPPVRAPTVTPVADGANTTELSVWMISQEGFLVPVVRRVELSEEALLASLLLGARTEERSSGLRSAIPPDAVAINVDVDEAAGTAIVDLGPGSLPGIAEDERLRAVGQIVYTLTGLFTIDQVIISIDGQREPMPTERGVTEPGQPLGRGDFTSLAPGVAPVPTPGPAPTPPPAPTPTPGAG